MAQRRNEIQKEAPLEQMGLLRKKRKKKRKHGISL